jgi:hypothetical protein
MVNVSSSILNIRHLIETLPVPHRIVGGWGLDSRGLDTTRVFYCGKKMAEARVRAKVAPTGDRAPPQCAPALGKQTGRSLGGSCAAGPAARDGLCLKIRCCRTALANTVNRAEGNAEHTSGYPTVQLEGFSYHFGPQRLLCSPVRCPNRARLRRCRAARKWSSLPSCALVFQV